MGTKTVGSKKSDGYLSQRQIENNSEVLVKCFMKLQASQYFMTFKKRSKSSRDIKKNSYEWNVYLIHL